MTDRDREKRKISKIQITLLSELHSLVKDELTFPDQLYASLSQCVPE